MRNRHEDKTFLTRTGMPFDQACSRWGQSSPCHIGSPPIRGRGLASNKDTRTLNKILYPLPNIHFSSFVRNEKCFLFSAIYQNQLTFLILCFSAKKKKYTLPDALSEKWKSLNTSENYWDFSSTNTKRNFSSFLNDPFVSFFTRKKWVRQRSSERQPSLLCDCSLWSQTQNFCIELWELLLLW